MKPFQIIVAALITFSLTGAAKPISSKAQIQEVTTIAEDKLAKGDFYSQLDAAYWASGQGEPMVPILADILKRERALIQTGGMTAFPFNAIWALGRIGTPKALAALERYQKGPHAHDAKLAIKAAKLRIQKHDKEVGVSSREDAQLFAAPNAKSKVLKVLVRGTPVKALSYRLASPSHEKAPGGGEAHYDQVKVLPNGPTGYLQRAGDDFATIY